MSSPARAQAPRTAADAAGAGVPGASSGPGVSSAPGVSSGSPAGASPGAGVASASSRSGGAARLPELWREVRRFARGILGSDAYDKYLAHHRVTGCAHAPMTEREFWRNKYAEQDASPEGRCC